MKVKPEHLDCLKKAIVPLDTEERRQVYRDGKFPRASYVKNLDQRYRWDLMYASGMIKYATDQLYDYCNDSHIDTALRSFIKPLGE